MVLMVPKYSPPMKASVPGSNSNFQTQFWAFLGHLAQKWCFPLSVGSFPLYTIWNGSNGTWVLPIHRDIRSKTKTPITKPNIGHFWAIYGPKFIFSIFLHNFTKVGLDQGVYGLRSDAPMGGEYLGTIRTIADGIKSKWSNWEWRNAGNTIFGPKMAQNAQNVVW